MFLLGTMLGIIIGMFLMAYIFVDTINEMQSLINARTKALKEAEKIAEENKELKELRKQEVHNNTILVDKNKELIELLREVADRTVCCPLDSEKIVLDKIKSLVRDYQSEN